MISCNRQLKAVGPQQSLMGDPEEGIALSKAVPCWQEQFLVESINSDIPSSRKKDALAFKRGSIWTEHLSIHYS